MSSAFACEAAVMGPPHRVQEEGDSLDFHYFDDPCEVVAYCEKAVAGEAVEAEKS